MEFDEDVDHSDGQAQEQFDDQLYYEDMEASSGDSGDGLKDTKRHGNSFERLESLEAIKTMGLMLESDFRLFESKFNYTTLMEEARRKTQRLQDERKNLMYYAEGYEANFDQADNTELSRWQFFFPHFQLVGEGYTDPRLFDNKNSEVRIEYVEVEENVVDSSPHPSGDILPQPLSTQLTSFVWKEVAEGMKPVVSLCLEYGEQNNVPLSVEELLSFNEDTTSDERDEFWD
jgi:hypothetical protein